MTRTLFIIDPRDNETIFTYYSEFDVKWPGQTEVEVFFMVVIFIFAVLSNFLVLAVIYRKGKLISATDLFIANISLSDILFAANLPLVIIARLYPNWTLGTTGCKLLLSSQCLLGSASIFSMLLISVDRYVVIVRSPYTARIVNNLTHKICLVVICFLWIFAIGISLPIFMAGEERRINFQNITYVFCAITWWPWFETPTYLGTLIALLFFVPLFLTVICYSKIFYVVFKSTKKLRLSRSGSISNTTTKLLRPDVRLAKTCAIIVLAFVLTWSPVFVAFCLILYTDLITSSQFLVCAVITQVTACIDPVIYGYFNESYRNGMKQIICFRRTFENSVSPQTMYKQSVKQQISIETCVTVT